MGTRWVYPPMGSIPIGVRWEAMYPLLDRAGLDPDTWNELHLDLMVMENKAIATMVEFEPKQKKT